MNTAAPIYHFVVDLPLYMGTNPGVVLIIWSMLTTSPGRLSFRMCVRAPLCQKVCDALCHMHSLGTSEVELPLSRAKLPHNLQVIAGRRSSDDQASRGL